MSNWENYYKKHAKRGPREQLVRAVMFCKDGRTALDLGAGTLVESAYLLESGFEKVTAVDSSPETSSFGSEFDPEKFVLQISSFQEFQFVENTYDLINAQFALPFHGPENFSAFLQKIIDSLKPNGIFVGQLFGIRDGWNTENSTLAFHTRAEVEKMFASLQILEFSEAEKEDKTASGEMKHWHIFYFIVMK